MSDDDLLWEIQIELIKIEIARLEEKIRRREEGEEDDE